MEPTQVTIIFGETFWHQLSPQTSTELLTDALDIISSTSPSDPDTLIFDTPQSQLFINGQQIVSKEWRVQTIFVPCERGLVCNFPEGHLLLQADLTERADLAEWFGKIKQRNELASLTHPYLAEWLEEIEQQHTVEQTKLPAKRNSPKDKDLTNQSIHVLRLPNCAFDRDLNRALADYPNWLVNENDITRYRDGREGTTVVYQPPEVLEALQQAQEQALMALDERFTKMKSVLTGDVIDILFHHWKHNKIDSQGGRAGITLARICQYRGVEARNENLENAWQAMRDTRSIRLKQGNIDGALFEMDSIDLSSPELPEKDTVYFFQPGYFLQFGLEGNKIYSAPFFESIWKLNPYKDHEAKRFARFLRGEWRLNADLYLDQNPGARCYKTWKNWLVEAGTNPDEWRGQGKNITREMDNIERMVETLYDLTFLGNKGANIYHPEDRPKLGKLPKRGRLEAWLDLRVCFLPSDGIKPVLAEGNQQRKAQLERNAQALAKAKATKQIRTQEKKRRQ